MIKSYFRCAKRFETVRFSGGQFQTVVEALHHAAGNCPLGSKPIQQKLPMGPKHPRHLLHGLDFRKHHPLAPARTGPIPATRGDHSQRGPAHQSATPRLDSRNSLRPMSSVIAPLSQITRTARRLPAEPTAVPFFPPQLTQPFPRQLMVYRHGRGNEPGQDMQVPFPAGRRVKPGAGNIFNTSRSRESR